MTNNFLIKDNVTEIYWRGNIILIDTEDLNKVSNYNWHINSEGYARARIKTRYRTMHRLILDLVNSDINLQLHIDHINRNKLDNRKSNLRICTNAENQQNAKLPITNKSGYKGIRFIEKQTKRPWRVNIRANKQKIEIGSYATLEEAIEARKQAELQYFTPIKSIIEVEG